MQHFAVVTPLLGSHAKISHFPQDYRLHRPIPSIPSATLVLEKGSLEAPCPSQQHRDGSQPHVPRHHGLSEGSDRLTPADRQASRGRCRNGRRSILDVLAAPSPRAASRRPAPLPSRHPLGRRCVSQPRWRPPRKVWRSLRALRFPQLLPARRGSARAASEGALAVRRAPLARYPAAAGRAGAHVPYITAAVGSRVLPGGGGAAEVLWWRCGSAYVGWVGGEH